MDRQIYDKYFLLIDIVLILWPMGDRQSVRCYNACMVGRDLKADELQYKIFLINIFAIVLRLKKHAIKF